MELEAKARGAEMVDLNISPKPVSLKDVAEMTKLTRGVLKYVVDSLGLQRLEDCFQQWGKLSLAWNLERLCAN